MNASMGLDTSNQLQSINEDYEAMDGQQMPTGAHLGRNTPGRQSKEFTAKLHKVSFPNFKKLKDSKGKSSPSGAAGGGTMAMTELNSSSSNKQMQQDAPPSSISAPLKQRASILKDKLINRNSSVPSEPLESSEKISLKLKNISLDSGTSTVGATVLGSSGANSNNNFDLTESCSDPLENSIATRPSILPLEYSGAPPGSSVCSGTNNNGIAKNSNVQVYQM